MPRSEKYPWSTTEVGQSFEVANEPGVLFTLRTAVGYQEKRHGRHFEVIPDGDRIVVTRRAGKVNRSVGRKDHRPWDEIEVGEYFDIMRTECCAQNVVNLVARRNARGPRRFYMQNLVDRWRIYRIR